MSNIPLSKPYFTGTEIDVVTRVLESGWVTQGPRVAEFERDFAQTTGATQACAVSNCTTALHLALKGVGVQAGDVVLTASMSFIATANAIRHCQAEPVFVDIDPATLNLCPDSVRQTLENDFFFADGSWWYRHVDRFDKLEESPLKRIREPRGRLAALLVVHQVGMPCNLPRLLPLAEELGVPVVEDAACGLGSMIRQPAPSANGGDAEPIWEPIGLPHAAVACFSFHPRKIITTGDGGMLTCRDADLDRRFRLWRQHGMSVSDTARHQSSQVIFESYETTGCNYRMTDLQAALGIAQLRKLDEIVCRRRQIVEKYREVLAFCADATLPTEPAYARSNWQSFQITLREPGRQWAVMQALADQGISTRRGVMCAHLETPYASAWPTGCLPRSEAAFRSGMILPLFPTMTDAQVDQVASALFTALARPTGTISQTAA